MKHLTEADLAQIANYIEEYSLNVVNQALQDDSGVIFNEIRLTALSFLSQTSQYMEKLKWFEAILQTQKILRNSNRNNYSLMDEYLQNKEKIGIFLQSQIPLKIYEAVFNFQNKLQEFLGKQIKMVFVFEGEEGPELLEILNEEILKPGYNKGKLIGRYQANFASLSGVCQSLELTNDLKFSLPGLKDTYSEVMYRYRKSKSKRKYIVPYQSSVKKKWQAMRVSSEGDINEAYASFILLNRDYPSFRKQLEQNIEEYLLEGVAKVDNISGLLTGDIEANAISYGIKSAGASTLGLAQVFALAQEIVLDSSYDLAKLKQKEEELKSKGKFRNKIVRFTGKKADELISEITDRFS